jgi:hypothetical protein
MKTLKTLEHLNGRIEHECITQHRFTLMELQQGMERYGGSGLLVDSHSSDE